MYYFCANLMSVFSNRYKIIGPVLLVVITVCIWYSSLSVPFQFDDEHVILDNSSLANPASFLSADPWFSFHGRTFAYFTFMLNFQAGGLNHAGYHAVNILIHLLSGLAVYGLILLLLGHFGKKEKSTNHILAFLGSAIFIVHPMQIESVTYISQRMTSLSGMFFLWSLFFYLRFRLKDSGKKYNLIIFIIFLILSFSSKQTALVMFPVLLSIEFILFSRNQTSKKARVLTAGIILSMILVSTLAFWMDVETRDSETLSRSSYFMSQQPVIINYISKIIVPLNLNIDYDIPVYKSFSLIPAISLFLILLILAGGILLRKKAPLTALGILFFFAALSVESSFFPIKDLMADHRVYVAITGLIIAWISLLTYFDKQLKWAMIFTGLIIIGYAILTIKRNEAWQSSISLWKDASEKSPMKSRTWNNLGFAYLEKDDIKKAEECFARAISLNPQDYSAWNNLGISEYRQKKYQRAIKSFYRSATINQKYFPALNNLGKTLLDLGYNNYALLVFNHILKIDSDNADAMYNKAVCFERLDRKNEAEKMYLETISAFPLYTDAHYNLGVLYMESLREADAKKTFLQLLKISPNDIDAMNNLAVIEYRNGHVEQAKQWYEKIIFIKPDHNHAINGLKNIALEK